MSKTFVTINSTFRFHINIETIGGIPSHNNREFSAAMAKFGRYPSLHHMTAPQSKRCFIHVKNINYNRLSLFLHKT